METGNENKNMTLKERIRYEVEIDPGVVRCLKSFTYPSACSPLASCFSSKNSYRITSHELVQMFGGRLHDATLAMVLFSLFFHQKS